MSLRRIRSRRSGRTAFVEIALDLDPGLSLAEVDRRLDTLRASIQSEAGQVEVAILARAASAAGP